MVEIVQKVCQEFKSDQKSPSVVSECVLASSHLPLTLFLSSLCRKFGQKYEDACEWMKSVEWSTKCHVDRDMILKVANTLVELNIIEATPDVSEIIKDI
eukprot:767176-Hanusia_phi.AAC.2